MAHPLFRYFGEPMEWAYYSQKFIRIGFSAVALVSLVSGAFDHSCLAFGQLPS